MFLRETSSACWCASWSWTSPSPVPSEIRFLFKVPIMNRPYTKPKFLGEYCQIMFNVHYMYTCIYIYDTIYIHIWYVCIYAYSLNNMSTQTRLQTQELWRQVAKVLQIIIDLLRRKEQLHPFKALNPKVNFMLVKQSHKASICISTNKHGEIGDDGSPLY